MGIDSADYDNDGWPDISKRIFPKMPIKLYHNDHRGVSRIMPPGSPRSSQHSPAGWIPAQ